MKYLKSCLEKLKTKGKAIKKEIRVLYIACKRPDVPWYAKAFAVLVVGYALSPVDLIPDFIPVLGYLDDLILIPLGISLAIRMIPENVLKECRSQADGVFSKGKPKNWAAGGVVILIWVLIIASVSYKIINLIIYSI